MLVEKEGKSFFERETNLVAFFRFFFYLRRFFQLYQLTYLKKKVEIWSSVLEWILDKTNITLMPKINIGLFLDIICETLLRSEVAFNQKLLQQV